MRNPTCFLYLACLLLLFPTLGRSQSVSGTSQPVAVTERDTPELVNSGDVLQRGVRLNDDGKFAEALALYKTVPRSDTNFNRVLYEMSLTAYNDSDFVGGMRYADSGLHLFPEQAPDWYSLMANALDNMGRKDSALAYYDKALACNTYAYQGWFNKGVTLYNMGRLDEAKQCFERALLIFPFHSSSHYFLGLVALREGNLVGAMYSLITNLLISPDNRHARAAVRLLEEIAGAEDEVTKAAASYQSVPENDDFSTAQEIVLSKAALDKQYKLQTDVEDAITRQVQVVLEKQPFDPSDKGFWMQYYVPFYQQTFAGGNYNTLVHMMFGSLQIKPVDDWNKHHADDLMAYATQAYHYFAGIEESERLPIAERDTASTRYLFEDGSFSGKGAWRDSGDTKILTGPWVFYYANGNLKSKGMLDNNQEKEGPWVFYYDNGQLEQRTTYKDGSPVGESESWFLNGARDDVNRYDSDGNLMGTARTCYYNGMTHYESEYVKGSRNGTVKEYLPSGHLQSITAYKDDKEDGESTFYYTNQKASSLEHYAGGQEDGKFQKFSPDGVLLEEGNYAGGKETGPWAIYFPSGRLEETFSYVGGKLNGEDKTYWENGKVHHDLPLTDGVPDGKESYYTESGRLYNENDYEKGKIREVRFYDASGKVTASSSIRNAGGVIVFYDSAGFKTQGGFYTKTGDREGVQTGYYPSGSFRSREEYKDDVLQGFKVDYDEHGHITDSFNYAQGRENGYFAFYYIDGRVRQDGWYQDGDREGPLSDYDQFGHLTARSYWVDGVMKGWQEYFSPSGVKTLEYLFRSGWFVHIGQYDTSGRVLSQVDLPVGDTVLVQRYPNGKPMSKIRFNHYDMDGTATYFYCDESLQSSFQYRHGVKDGPFVQNYLGGKLRLKGSYEADQRTGTWTYYYENGGVYSVEHYVEDQEDGKDELYNEDGSLIKVTNYRRGTLEGPSIYYGDANVVALVVNYHDGDVVSYTYEGADGKLLSPVPLRGGTGTARATYSNGQPSAEFQYLDGKLDGVRKIYFTNGKLYLDAVDSLNLDEGTVRRYYSSGQLREDLPNLNDHYQGWCRYYYPNGKLKAEEYYVDGDQEGPSRYYDENGALKQTRVYFYGVLENVQ